MSATAIPRPHRPRSAWRRHATLVAGGVVLAVIVVLAIVSIWVTPYDPAAFAIRVRLQGPTWAHWFGTDEFGRDVLSRVLAGAHHSLVMGFAATAISLAIGVPLGLAAAFYRGPIDEAIMRGIDLMIALPPILLGLLILAVTKPSLVKTILAVGIVYVPIMARITRSVALSLLEEDFIQAARARGEGALAILFYEVLPNAWPPIIVESGLRVTFAILLGSSLSFLGLGPQPPSSEWGLMIAESRAFIDQAPWIGLAPGLSLCVLLIAVNLFGEGLRELLDPRLKGAVATEIALDDRPAEALGPRPLLDIDGLSVAYRTARGPVRALDDVSLSIGKGEALGLVGESGSGKSSVVLAILGLLGSEAVVRADRARFDGADLLANAPALRGRRIATVFQDPSSALNPALSIGLQLCEPFTVHRGLGLEDARHRAGALLAEVGIPQVARVLDAYPHQLSGGMKQRVAIAMALAADPDLLLLDEPTTALDVTVEAQILDLLERLRERRGLSMLLVSHNLGIVDRLCDRLLVLYAGRTLEAGPTPVVLHHPRHPYTGGLLGALPRIVPGLRFRLAPIPGNLPDLTLDEPGCNFRPRCALAVPSCAAAQPFLRVAPDHQVRCHRAVGAATLPGAAAGDALAAPVATASPPLIEATGLARRFGGGGFWSGLPVPAFLRGKGDGAGVLAVGGVSLAIRAGETLGLVGESGCGKSTLGRLLLRLIAADAGTVSFDGANVPARPDATFRRRAQIVFQNPDSSLNPRMTVEAILRRPLRHFGLATGPQAATEIDRLLDLVRLPRDYRQRYPHQLSGGEKQRVGIARALASRPDFIVCDEAVSALDVSVQAAILNLLDELRRALGVAYLFISHDIGVIAQIADRIAVMYRGRIVEEGRAVDVLQPPYHPYTEALLSAVPVVGARDREAGRVRLAGDPSAAGEAGGCPFAPRCPRKVGSVCDTTRPPRQVTASGHAIDCHISLTDLATVSPVFPAAPGARAGDA